ncbi:MAG: phosphatase [Flavobacteriales bacterium]|nr:phosphatase [Flavobacteriales bacterium]
MRPQAIVDLGTNTFNLLVFERGVDGMRILYCEELPIFLGKGGIEKGVITDDAFARGMEALRMQKATAVEHGAPTIIGFGTSMLRNARNGHDFVQRAREELGIAISIIPGDQEAELILAGVRQAVPFGAQPSLVMDIGGGSTEFILATNKALMWKRSFELGVTRLRERISISDPITVEEETRIARHLDNRLEALYAVVERQEPHVLVGSAGSFDTLAHIVAEGKGNTLLQESTTLPFSAFEFDAIKDHLLRMTREERLRVPGLPEHRADTIPYALISIERVLIAGEIRELAWSRYALKEGAAARMNSGQGS